jgi:hypothetical protein
MFIDLLPLIALALFFVGLITIAPYQRSMKSLWNYSHEKDLPMGHQKYFNYRRFKYSLPFFFVLLSGAYSKLLNDNQQRILASRARTWAIISLVGTVGAGLLAVVYSVAWRNL